MARLNKNKKNKNIKSELAKNQFWFLIGEPGNPVARLKKELRHSHKMRISKKILRRFLENLLKFNSLNEIFNFIEW